MTTKRRLTRMMWLPVVLLIMAGLLTACSPRKNTAASRHYQAFITKYNIYYNGDEHFKETLKEMETKYEDDYSQRVFMHPVEAKEKPKSPQPTGNFDRSIEKAQKAIQLRSIKKRPAKKGGRQTPEQKAWLKRSEYNPFLHNAWMMMGRSQYYNGDFAGAAATFHYVSKQFGWLPKTVLEAKLWMARSYCAMDWLFEAETILTRIKTDELTDKTLRGLYYFTYADYYIRMHQERDAIGMLTQAISYAKGAQKTRLRFLLGQLYAAVGDKKQAYECFKKAGSASSASYRTKFNARIKQSEVYEGADIRPEVKALKRMTRYDRNKDYLDQIYYAIGNLYLSRRDTAAAIENYKLAAEKSTRSGIDKAISQLTLGRLYFERGEYNLAQPCYSEAVPQLPEDYRDYALIKKRSDVLDELAVYSQNVELQDSLLRLAAMPEAERMKVIEKLIEELKKKEKEEAEAAARDEYMAQQEAAGTGLKNNNKAPNTFTLNSDNSWYFYNTATRNAGKTEFQRRWGSRKLEDDWRRRNKTTFDTGSFDSDDSEDSDESEAQEGAEELDEATKTANDSIAAAAEKASDPHNPEYYLAQIPSTPEEIQTSNDVIQEGLYNMGVILKNKLGDYPAAEKEFDELLERYPDNVYRLDTYYNMYLMFMQAGQPDKAEVWRQLILKEFPDSKYGQAMTDPQYLENLRNMGRVQEELYGQTYEDYLDNRNDRVHSAYEKMQRDYPMSPLMPKFMFLHALAYVTENKPDEFNKTLREMLERYPQTDMTDLASAYLQGMARGRKINSGSGVNARGMLWDTRLLAPNDSTAASGDEGPVEFKLDPTAPHLLLLLYDAGDVEANQLLYEVARHNFSAYVVRDFDLEQLKFGDLGILEIKGFANEAEAAAYRGKLESDPNFKMPPGVRPLVISADNFDLMLKRGASFEQYFEFAGEETMRKVHEETLPPDEYEGPEATAPEEPQEPVEQPEEPVEPQPGETSSPAAPSAPSTPEPQLKPEVKPEPKPQPKPQPKPEPKPQPKPEPQPQIPGSEGDDPLLD